MMKRVGLRIRGCLGIGMVWSLVGAALPALAEVPPSNDWGVLVMAHGGDAAWNQAVEETVAPLRGKLPIEIAFGMARTSTLRDATRRLEGQGVGESPLVDEILVDRVKALSSDPSKESVLLFAHGPADEAENERWLAHMRLRVQRLHQIGPFRHVHVETLREDWPERRAVAERRIQQYVEAASANGGRALVVPFRVAGFGPYAEVLNGLKYASDGRGFCPHPNMTRWIESTADECRLEGKVSGR